MANSIKSPNQSRFAQAPNISFPRASFNRNHGLKTTFNAGDLIPILSDEVLPGDSFNCRLTAFARLATPIKPFMDNMKMDTHFFFVPNRLLWENWERFNGAQTDPGDSTDYLIPQVDQGTISAETVSDYLGLPVGVDILANSLHHRAYNLIWNEWFRDENLQDSAMKRMGDGPDLGSDFPIRKRGKRHDYFTSCLPFPQKGPAVQLPIGSTAPVHGTTTDPIEMFNLDTPNGPNLMDYDANDPSGIRVDFGSAGTNNDRAAFGVETGLFADLTAATAANINDLRQAFAVQKLFEKDSRGGTRYTELVKSHFGVTSPDSRLQRPEYLGGGTSNLYVNPVAQTGETGDMGTSQTPQGNLAGFGTVGIDNHGFTKSFTEHGVIIGLVSVRADLTYQQGLNRMFQRQTRQDFFWPSLAHIGEQGVKNSEIFAQGTSADDDIFGYQERYAEYRYKPSMITGRMRSSFPQSLDVWHLAQDFENLPVLNEEFIEENPPVERVIAVVDEPQFLFDGHFSLRCARPMPMYSVPGMIDRF